ncbi:hypothetical protein Taro_020350 [Colocasia esculenta]|uniref:CCHC-type domain-containing protein n=1 Tax=Colocasia esculenta TaxID=4460 RepID=A0A843UW70_COLES|nr:hypothetical protein [Colocasia esculenta]
MHVSVVCADCCLEVDSNIPCRQVLELMARDAAVNSFGGQDYAVKFLRVMVSQGKREARAMEHEEKRKTSSESETFGMRSLTLDELLSTARFAASTATEKPMCMHCNKHHGGNQCWAQEGRCLKCSSKDHRIKECPRLKKFDPRSATTSTSKEPVAELQAPAKEKEDFILFPDMAPMATPEFP